MAANVTIKLGPSIEAGGALPLPVGLHEQLPLRRVLILGQAGR